MSAKQHALGSYSAELFLREYWQKKSLFIPGALSGFENPLSAETLAGIACEDFVESRLITGSTESGHWRLEHGPFDENTFTELPQEHWTLHIQGVENYNRAVYRLFDYFRFLPTWRLDDIMVSYSPDQGSAGPHFDQYDVFLIQTQGNKRWFIGDECDAETPLLKTADGLQLLENFDANAGYAEYIAKPGDVLYIPPGVAHYGVAEGESITYSVGFRAPTAAELCLSLAQELAELELGDTRYSDPDLALEQHCGRLANEPVLRMRQLLDSVMNEVPDANRLGRFLTQPKQQSWEVDAWQSESDQADVENDMPPEVFHQTIANKRRLYWSLGTRFCFTHENSHLSLYVNGEHLPCSPQQLALIEELTSGTEIDLFESNLSENDFLNEESLELLYTLYVNGWINLSG